MRRILFLIPVRGGSKGLPGKNLLPVGGTSLLGRSVSTALEAAKSCPNATCTVAVSTDDSTLAQEARDFGAEVPFMRPGSLATDEASTIDVVLHALDEFDRSGTPFDAVVLLQVTSPLTASQDILGALALFFAEDNADPVVSVTPAPHPPQWSFTIETGRMEPVFSDWGAHRRQEMAASFALNGAVYIGAPEQLRRDRSFIVPAKTIPYVMPAERSVDIDSENDLRLAEHFLAESRQLPAKPQPIKIGRQRVGDRLPAYVIAEAGVNHNGDVAMAIRLAEAAKEAGADSVKFQTFRAERVATAAAPKADYQLRSTSPEESQVEMLKKLELSMDDYMQLVNACKAIDITFLSTPYGIEDIEFLEELGVPAYKVASALLVEPFFLRKLAATQKPIILSTGLATLSEAADAVDTLVSAGNSQVIVLQCTTNYPSALADTHLRAMTTMRESLGTLVGYSDHTETPAAILAAIARDACVIEKHLTLDRQLPGPDHACSVEPQELKELITQIREVECLLGSPEKRPTAAERENLVGMRRSIVSARDIPQGTRLTEADLTAKRPATGISPTQWDDIVGRKARGDISADTVLTWDMICDQPDADNSST